MSRAWLKRLTNSISLEHSGMTADTPAIAVHRLPWTTKFDDWTGDEITLDKGERIAI